MPSSANPDNFAPFQQHLMGTWTNQDLPGISPAAGGKSNPLSYNIMPLPQTSSSPGVTPYPGYILKNFTYYETVKFNTTDQNTNVAVSAKAPNRGGDYAQDCFALFYEQQVHFAEGPQVNNIVHVENGSWLHLATRAQGIGPYGTQGTEPGTVQPQPADATICKQMSVPHGNSILSLGSYDDPKSGRPDNMHPTSTPYPTGSPPLSSAPYTTLLNQSSNYQNPQTDLTANAAQPIQTAAAQIAGVNTWLYFYVTTDPLTSGQGIVTNIPFEDRAAKVTGYNAWYWLLSTDGGSSYQYLLYFQLITMVLTINGNKYSFPHITSNAVTKTSD